jgi:hypothetical protein
MSQPKHRNWEQEAILASPTQLHTSNDMVVTENADESMVAGKML